jgi:signal transduction histidine kinase
LSYTNATDTARQIQQARSEVENTAALEKMSAQDKFLRKVLHEIRTPCNVIMQGLDLAETRDAAVHTQMMRLLRIVKVCVCVFVLL